MGEYDDIKARLNAVLSELKRDDMDPAELLELRASLMELRAEYQAIVDAIDARIAAILKERGQLQ